MLLTVMHVKMESLVMKQLIPQTMTAVSVLALALAVGGCGGSSNTMSAPEPPAPMPDPAIAERATIDSALMAARTAIDAVDNDSTDAEVMAADAAVTAARNAITAATNVPKEERDAHTGTVNALASRLNAAKTDRMTAMDDKAKADRMAMNAMAMKLHAGLDPAATGTGTGTALNSATVAVTSTGGVTGASDGSTTDVTFKKTDTMVMGYGAWKGADYVVKTDTMTDHAVVYTNQGAGKQVPIADKHGGSGGILSDDTGRISQSGLASNPSLVAGSDFASGSGGKNHTEAAGDTIKVSGTFDGADGLYQCAQAVDIACRSQVDGAGGLILSGGWTFKPDNGAMVPEAANANFVAYGWWSREASAGVDVIAFVDTVGTSAVVSSTAGVTGTATYMGGAAGKYAISNPLGDDSEAGAFTAKAMLTAKFGNATDEGTVSGMLTDFMSGGMAKDWTVMLKGAGTNEGAAIASGVIGGGLTTSQTGQTVWSIGETPAGAAGSWGGSFYDAGTGTGDAPMTAAGTFRAEYGPIGRMYGAFGATKEEE